MRERPKSPCIRVSGFLPPFVPRRRNPMRAVALIRALNLVGPLGAAGIMLTVLVQGTPHLLLASTSTGYGAARYYADCAYAGLDGRMVHVRGGACPLFRLLHQGH